uniref:Glycosyltransferase family 24 protein n=1 Tax=Mycena chlorophos TaxID=658473 RepID=A0ABQ0M4P1_MYCCL|nr:predicted protein [Mycena chlorophos]
MRRRPRTTALCVVVAVSRVLGAASPPVKVTLKSAWPAPPLLLEIVETVSQENPDAFFPLLDRVSDPAESIPSSDEAIHQFALQLAVSGGLLSEPGSLAAVEMNLGLHAATPKIEAFYQYYETHLSTAPDCRSWVDWYGEQVCDVEKLAHLAGLETIDASNASDAFPSFSPPKLLPFDHIHPSPTYTLDRPPRTAILYGSIDSPRFRELHSYLYGLADKPSPHIEYVFRPIPGQLREEPNFLSGYGVALDLKKMDYLALDDRNVGNGRVAEDANSDAEVVAVDPVLALIEAYPEPENVATELSEQAIARLGFQAIQLIADSDEPLATLTQLAQNFPRYMTALSRRVVVNESLEVEVHANQLKAQAGVNMLWLNGMTVNDKDITPMGLLRLIHKEQAVMRSLTGLGLSRSEAIDLLSHPAVSTATQADSVLDNVFDASDRPEEGDVIVWWNDFEKDSRYEGWLPSVHGLLRPIYPGQFHSVKLNLYNVVIAVDLSRSSSFSMVVSIANIINRGFPFRFGIVPLVETEDGLKMARLFYHLVDEFGRKKTMTFFRKIAETFVMPQQPLNWNAVRAAYNELLEDVVLNVESEDDPQGEGQPATPEAAGFDFDSVIEGDPDGAVELSIQKSRVYAERLGATLAESPGGHGFVNGKHLDIDDGFWRAMQGEVARQFQYFQEMIYSGKITDENSAEIPTYFYDQPTTSRRRNQYIFPASGEVRLVNMPELLRRTGLNVKRSAFVYPAETELIPLTMFVVGDFDSSDGLALLHEALLSIDEESITRLTFIHNPTKLEADSGDRPHASWLLAHLVGKNLMSKASSWALRCALGGTPHTPEDWQDPLGLPCAQELTGGIGISEYSAADYAAFVRSGRLLARELQFAPGENGLVINGRIVGPLPAGAVVATDFKTLEQFELTRRAEPVLTALGEIKPESIVTDRASSAELISMATSVLGALQAPEPGGGGIFDPPKRPRQRNYELLDGEYTSFQYGDNTTALYQIAAILDPLSETAAKWSSLLEWISHIADIFIKVYTNPAPQEEIPLKRFYRYALLPSLVFDSDGKEAKTQAVFEGLPIDPIYTLAMDVPSSWLVRPREALYDLDNIQLGSLSHPSLDAEFALDYLVVEGHARDAVSNMPPRGVQIQLLTGDAQPWISHIQDIFIKVYTNPAAQEEIPLKRFYRYALLPSLAFDSDGKEAKTQAVFEGLPIDPIYTLAMDVPSSWLVRPREALYDLDNIQLGSLSHPSLDAEFALDYLVVEGHARDAVSNMPPRGVQIQLLTGDAQPVDDTQVVANLGYLQFKAKPGVFQLEIREGRGRDIFEMHSVGNEGLDSRTVAEVGNEIAVTSFAGLTIYPRLRRLPGMEHEDVLATPAVQQSSNSGGIIDDIASRMKSFFGSKPQDSTEVAPVSNGQADINIFTVASGLLYERFVGIMILSVLKNTKSSVKFWFIENFLSPSFLEFIPHLADAYNFQYELVTYKWPSWLRAQKEKQRIIWAYKILFLDVLFPMDLKKVIFVDADQIVRADLKELIDTDLHGAPYGYTPMGDDNYDMEGFRFWKTGYWKDFLQGMPYHISALYVIDLVRFRQLAAGDILRGQYQALSADPGSLANLDQDLPNNLQREVPIFSLHEDWLWCETWCSKDRLHRAKTIDLCQNPLTKEPKLARARQIPEWEEYDSEISRFARRLAEDGIIRSQIISTDINALAGNGASKPKEEEQKPSSAPVDEPVAVDPERARDEL